MRECMQSCIQLYSDLIEEVKPGSSNNILPADLPTDIVSGGGHAPAPKFGDRWEHFPDHKCGGGYMTGPARPFSLLMVLREAPMPNYSLNTRITRMNFYARSADGGDASVTPDGQHEDTWYNPSCHRNASANWTGKHGSSRRAVRTQSQSRSPMTLSTSQEGTSRAASWLPSLVASS